MARILGVHGIHNWSWSKNSFTDKFLDALSFEHEVIDVKYPRMWAWLAYFDWAKNRRAKKLIEASKNGDVVIAHSFGCLLTILAMRAGVRYSKVFLFAAAAESDVEFPENGYDELYVIHSSSDRALKAGAKLPKHAFGELGLKGYTGNNKNVININAGDMQHSDYVNSNHFCYWVNFINTRIKQGAK